MALNALVPHLALTLLQRHDMPGMASGLLLILPAALACIHQDLQSGRMDRPLLLSCAPWVLLLTLVALRALLGQNERLRPPPPSSRGGEETKRK